MLGWSKAVAVQCHASMGSFSCPAEQGDGSPWGAGEAAHPNQRLEELFLGALVYRADTLISQGHHQPLQRWRGDSTMWWEEWGCLLVTVRGFLCFF